MTEGKERCLPNEAHSDGDFTEDTFFDGTIRVRQPRFGYRFSLDAVVLAHAVRPRQGETVLDLGTGCGVIPILLGSQYKDVRIYAVEIQEELASLAKENVILNRLESRIHILHADLRTMDYASIPLPVDRVVSNPPFRRIPSGRINPNTQRAIARHEVALTLGGLFQVVRSVLKTGGRLAMIYCADRLAELFSSLDAFGLRPKMLRNLHSYQNSVAKLCLVEAVKGACGGLTIAPPLIIYESGRVYTKEVRQMFIPQGMNAPAGEFGFMDRCLSENPDHALSSYRHPAARSGESNNDGTIS